ncbi:sensor histidine kinase [Emticicia sp. TH156]|uniref:sensor histidine kinase n=1 Tax=Emticicia sp. TH156 TaxID=2067454 RepID=UPI000C78C867|nr:histidine kinase [Emticicia sp. TH156]PLK46232.1 hypothetical protein C0V77_02495 [Emticicia sp. TH156]
MLKLPLKIVFLCFFVSYSVYSQQAGASKNNNNFKAKITRVEIAGRDVSLKKSYVVDYDHNVLQFTFAVTPARDSLIFKYRIVEDSFEGPKSSDWSIAKGNSAKVDSLKPAAYHFEVKAIDTNKVESLPAVIEFKIEYPWWRSWWFWGVCFITLFGLFYGRERFLKFWSDEEQRHHRQVTELELRTLQLQMNPHFVFNALNAVQSFILNRDTISANNYLSKFANLIRLFLDSSRSKYITLADEIKLLSLYVEIEMMRFENKFEFHLHVAPDIDRFVEIPTMILQPFIENAINHGLRYKEGKGNLYMSFYNQGKYLVCRIEDDGVGRDKAKQIQSKSRKGYKSQGLKITEERLHTFNLIADADIHFMVEDRLKPPYEPGVDIGTTIEIKFPEFH